MDVEALCGCGARITLRPGTPSDLGNAHGYASNNTSTVDSERKAVADALAGWVDAHRQCNRQPPEFRPECRSPELPNFRGSE